jgi:hypothetical protein
MSSTRDGSTGGEPRPLEADEELGPSVALAPNACRKATVQVGATTASPDASRSHRSGTGVRSTRCRTQKRTSAARIRGCVPPMP